MESRSVQRMMQSRFAKYLMCIAAAGYFTGSAFACFDRIPDAIALSISSSIVVLSAAVIEFEWARIKKEELRERKD